MPDIPALYDRARRLADDHQWDEAGLAFARLGVLCARGDNLEGARSAWEAAGEAWRRADRLAAAARALRDAIAVAPDAQVVRVKLAGVLSDAGELSDAEATCRRVIARASDAAVLAVAADTAIGVLQARGLKEEARALLVHLPDTGPPPARAARWFRQAQIARLDGRLDEAWEGLARVTQALEGVSGAGSGLAAARGERAEIALLRGSAAQAIAFFEGAVAQHEAWGRRSLALRAEAGRVRATVEAGAEPLARGLDEGVRWAEERSLPVVAIDLRIARGMARAATDPAAAAADLDQATRLAEERGMPLRSGRARLERASRVPMTPVARRDLLERAIHDLGANAPVAMRASLALAALLVDTEPPRARRLAARAADQFATMGLSADEERARDLLLRLS